MGKHRVLLLKGLHQCHAISGTKLSIVQLVPAMHPTGTDGNLLLFLGCFAQVLDLA